jgi:hypothetical protein
VISPRRPRPAGTFSLALLALACATVLLGDARPSMADTRPAIHAEYNAYQPSARYLVLNGEKVPGARVYERWVRQGRTSRLGSCLVTGVPGYGALIVVNFGSKTYKVRPVDVRDRDDGGRDVIAAAEVTEMGPARIEPSTSVLHFDLPASKTGGPRVPGELRPAPILLGWQSLDAVLSSNPNFMRDSLAFEPDAAAMQKLAAVGGEWRMDLYFGTWCTRCERYMGRIIGVADTQLATMRRKNPATTKIVLRFYGLPPVGGEDGGFYADPEVKRHRIGELPAGLVYRDNELIGRVAGANWERPAQALAALLASAPAAPTRTSIR